MAPGAVDLFDDLLAVLPEQRQIHSRAVGLKAASLSGVLSPGFRADLVTAATLHDIGYGHPLTGFHPIDGARFLGGLGFSDLVCHLVAHHTASSLEAEERGLNLEVFDDFRIREPSSFDSMNVARAHGILWWADLTTSPDGKDVDVEDRLNEIRTRYGPNDPVTRFVGKAWKKLIATGQLPIGSIQVPVSSIAH